MKNLKPKQNNYIPQGKFKQIHWTSKSISIDEETGEIINQEKIHNENYIKIHTDTTYQLHKNQIS